MNTNDRHILVLVVDSNLKALEQDVAKLSDAFGDMKKAEVLVDIRLALAESYGVKLNKDGTFPSSKSSKKAKTVYNRADYIWVTVTAYRNGSTPSKEKGNDKKKDVTVEDMVAHVIKVMGTKRAVEVGEALVNGK